MLATPPRQFGPEFGSGFACVEKHLDQAFEEGNHGLLLRHLVPWVSPGRGSAVQERLAAGAGAN